jgi:hypothetical protein
MKMMGKIIDKMMGDTDKEAFEEMMPALTIKISTDGQATVTKDEIDGAPEMDEAQDDDEEVTVSKVMHPSPRYVEEKE